MPDMNTETTLYMETLREMMDGHGTMKNCLALCLDPVHVGDGAYRMGAVDNTIMRDRPTGLPLIPGTTIKGMMRYGMLLYLAEKSTVPNRSALKTAEDVCNLIFGHASDQDKAGDKQEKSTDNTGPLTRALAEGTGSPGLVRFYDSYPVLFPVNSNHGTVWITTGRNIAYWQLADGKPDILQEQMEDDTALAVEWPKSAKGALYNTHNSKSATPNIRLSWLYFKLKKLEEGRIALKLPDDLINRVVLVSERSFSKLINDNLDVRTSVKIDKETGAAEEGALFTYESIPRYTAMGLELSWPVNAINRILQEFNANTAGDTGSLLEKSLARLEVLGVGGYGNKGFGRLKIHIL